MCTTAIRKRTTDNRSVFAIELAAIYAWSSIAPDSLLALPGIRSEKYYRYDILNNIFHIGWIRNALLSASFGFLVMLA